MSPFVTFIVSAYLYYGVMLFFKWLWRREEWDGMTWAAELIIWAGLPIWGLCIIEDMCEAILYHGVRVLLSLARWVI